MTNTLKKNLEKTVYAVLSRTGKISIPPVTRILNRIDNDKMYLVDSSSGKEYTVNLRKYRTRVLKGDRILLSRDNHRMFLVPSNISPSLLKTDYQTTDFNEKTTHLTMVFGTPMRTKHERKIEKSIMISERISFKGNSHA